ncbi:MAG: hypothetical protein WBB34_11565 [Xanthobacteraceae bacterium]
MQPKGPRREPKTIGLRSPCPPQKESKWTPFSKFFAGILAVATLVGGVAAVVAFLPRMTVEASGPFDVSPLPVVTFTVTNTGVMPLEDVSPRLGFCALGINFGMTDNPVPPFNKCNGNSTGFLSPTNWQHRRLNVDVPFTVTWDDAFHNQTGGQVDYADVIVTVAYRPWFLPWHREKTFRFVTRKMSDNKLYWFARPLAD